MFPTTRGSTELALERLDDMMKVVLLPTQCSLGAATDHQERRLLGIRATEVFGQFHESVQGRVPGMFEFANVYPWFAERNVTIPGSDRQRELQLLGYPAVVHPGGFS